MGRRMHTRVRSARRETFGRSDLRSRSDGEVVVDTQRETMRLVQDLEDELDQFPLASVIRSHARLAEDAIDAWSERLATIGNPGRRFWDHPAELMYDEVGILLGAMFVLVQAAITETVSIVKRIHELNGQQIRKDAILSLDAEVDPKSGISFPAIANAAANYYKHRFEWPNDWLGSTSKQQQDTIKTIRLIGMNPGVDLAENLLAGVDAITLSIHGGPQNLAGVVVEQWRSKLAARMRSQFNLPPAHW